MVCVVEKNEPSDLACDRCDREKTNFLYRKLFTPDLNDFLYTKVIYLSVTSVTHEKDVVELT